MSRPARLYAFFFEDQRARLKMYTTSGAVAFIFGIASLALGSSSQESAIGSVFVVFIMMSVWTFLYCSRREVSEQKLAEDFPEFNYDLAPRRIAIAGALLSLSILLGLSTKSIEAAVMDRRLRRATSGEPPMTQQTH